jgi:Flp pilus assembly protein TadG
MLESAFVFLPMMALFFGIIDFGFVMFLQSNFQNAAREGARFAITYADTYNGQDCKASQAVCIAQVVQDNATGFLSGSKANAITVNYYTLNDLTNPVMTCNSGTCLLKGALPQTVGTRIVQYANTPGNIVEVVIANYRWAWLAPIWGDNQSPSSTNYYQGSGMNISSTASDVLGGLAVGSSIPPGP